MKVGLVGWRGMVGSVLMQRMVEENDFARLRLAVKLPQHLWMHQTLTV